MALQVVSWPRHPWLRGKQRRTGVYLSLAVVLPCIMDHGMDMTCIGMQACRAANVTAVSAAVRARAEHDANAAGYAGVTQQHAGFTCACCTARCISVQCRSCAGE